MELQKAYLIKLRADLKNPDMFRKIYNFTFDYTKDESQKSMGASSLPSLSIGRC